MSKNDVREEARAKRDEFSGDVWLDDGELSEAEKFALDAAMAEYRKRPDAGGSWAAARARIEAGLRA